MTKLRLILALVLGLGVAAAPALAHPTDDDSGLDESVDDSGLWAAEAQSATPTPVTEDADPRALTEFRPVLDPYGEWYDHPDFGLLWVPSRAAVGDDFVPYLTRGRWALDTHGNWVWQSDYAFGWVVFHYGRWALVPGIGWAWVPGYTYAPAWVVWGSPSANIAYVGWAPLAPDFVWVGGVAVVLTGSPATYWVFCRSHYALSSRLDLHVVRDEGRHAYLARRTKEHTVAPLAPRPTHKWYTPLSRSNASAPGTGGVKGPEVTGERRPGSARVERVRPAPTRSHESAPRSDSLDEVRARSAATPPRRSSAAGEFRRAAPRIDTQPNPRVLSEHGATPRTVRTVPERRSAPSRAAGTGRVSPPKRGTLKPAKLRPKRRASSTPVLPTESD